MKPIGKESFVKEGWMNSLPSNPQSIMFTKLEVVTMIANAINVILCIHVALSTWVDHTTVPFGYFYIMCVGLILNTIYSFKIGSWKSSWRS